MHHEFVVYNPTVVYDELQLNFDERQLDSLSDYFKRWKIKENSSKSHAIYFTRCWSPLRLPSFGIVLSEHEIPWTPEVKYLGLILDKKLTFASHTSKSIKKVERTFQILYSFLNMKSKLCLHNKLSRHGLTVLSSIIQNKCLKIIKNRHWRTGNIRPGDECAYDRGFWRKDLWKIYAALQVLWERINFEYCWFMILNLLLVEFVQQYGTL
jgi:hypothetical protein